MKILKKLCLAGAGLVVILLVALVAISWSSGVKVEIINLGPQSLQNVSVDVTGASYSVGDIASGNREAVSVEARSDSAASINYLDHSGKKRTLYVDTYIEPGYSGNITVQVKQGQIVHVQQNIKITRFL